MNKKIKLLHGDATNGKQKLNNLLETNIRLVVVSAFFFGIEDTTTGPILAFSWGMWGIQCAIDLINIKMPAVFLLVFFLWVFFNLLLSVSVVCPSLSLSSEHSRIYTDIYVTI